MWTGPLWLADVAARNGRLGGYVPAGGRRRRIGPPAAGFGRAGRYSGFVEGSCPCRKVVSADAARLVRPGCAGTTRVSRRTTLAASRLPSDRPSCPAAPPSARPARPPATSLWQRCSSQPAWRDVVVAAVLAGEGRCGSGAPAGGPGVTSLWQRCPRSPRLRRAEGRRPVSVAAPIARGWPISWDSSATLDPPLARGHCAGVTVGGHSASSAMTCSIVRLAIATNAGFVFG
jgi:hypothetical protein